MSLYWFAPTPIQVDTIHEMYSAAGLTLRGLYLELCPCYLRIATFPNVLASIQNKCSTATWITWMYGNVDLASTVLDGEQQTILICPTVQSNTACIGILLK